MNLEMDKYIVVVDDDEDDCNFLKESIFQIGVRLPVHCLYNGQAVLDLLRERKYNLPVLIILDVNMPAMDGLEVLENIVDEYGVPTILYSTSCDDETLKKAKDLGAIDCVKKGTSYTDNLKFAKRIAETIGDLKTH
jgi:two-component system response regulator YesN